MTMLQTLRIKLEENENKPGAKRVLNWKLPHPDFIYGKKDPRDREGASIGKKHLIKVTRSWSVHNPSKDVENAQNFIALNKEAIKKNCISFKTHADFRRQVEINKQIHKGKIERKIILPPMDFTYGVKVRPSTPIKNVINYFYSKKAEDEMKRSYSQLLLQREHPVKFSPRMTKNFIEKLEEKKEKIKQKNEKNSKIFKIKKFLKVESKLKENLKNFKTYLPCINDKKGKGQDNIDNLINKVEEEIKAIDNQ